MKLSYYELISLILIITVLYGIRLMSSPRSAVRGNQLGAINMLVAVLLVLIHNNIVGQKLLWISLAVGAFVGYFFSVRVTMIQMPQLVALFNGLGGGASMLVALIILFQGSEQLNLFNVGAAWLAIAIGGITLSGSLVAAAKLHQVLAQKPVILKNHNALAVGNLLLILGVGLLGAFSIAKSPILPALTTAFLSLLFGVLFTVRVGGADMPLTISLLNSLSGLAGAITGFAISDPLLVAIGAIVGSAGLILTQIMCRAMNRSLLDILTGGTVAKTTPWVSTTQGGAKIEASDAPGKNGAKDQEKTEGEVIIPPLKKISLMLREAQKIIIVPGYGMALAQAQSQVKKLADIFEEQGKEVKYAIHPVAGRMPGHMNVLLAEVDVPYEQLYEMDVINPKFAQTDAAIIVGASDVVNPAAIHAPDTPIYGMPILRADEAKQVVICNLDTKPGYSGVENPLYQQQNVTLLLGDAADTVAGLIENLK